MKDWKGRNYTFDFVDPSKPVRTFRQRRPSHFIFEIESFSKLETSLKTAGLNSFETPEFDVAGDKWVLCIYPNGRGRSSSYVSLYLKRLSNRTARNKAIDVSIKFFILDQIGGDYLVIEDMGETHFDVRGKEYGIMQALERNHFTKDENGLLFEDRCTFGVEVYITSGEPHYSKMSLINRISKRTFFVQLGPFTPQSPEPMDSQVFTTVLDGESYIWKLQLFREGNDEGAGTHLSVYLELDDKSKLTNGRSMFVNSQLSLQNKVTGQYVNELTKLVWYTESKASWGFPQFIERSVFFNPRNNYTIPGDTTLDVKVYFESIFVLDDMDG